MFESPYRSKKEGQQKQSFLLVRVGRFGKLRSRSRRAGIEQQSTGLLHFKCSNLPIGAKKKDSNKLSFFFGPSGEIRTPGILNPNQAPYQLGHTRKYTVDVLSDVAPYSRYAALSGCKQKQASATPTKQLGHTRKYTVDVLSDVAPYSRYAALSGCKQKQASATPTKQLGRTRKYQRLF